MRFLDANVFVYAYYKPRGKLTKEQKDLKDKAKAIVKAINEGREEVITSVVHLSEISNILKRAMPTSELHNFLLGLYSRENVKIVGVTSADYLLAIELMNELDMDPSDTLAVAIMKRNNLKEIYTFDKGFDKIKEIKRKP